MDQPTLNPNDRRIIATLILGVFLPLLDATIVNVAIHSLCTALGSPLETVQWVVTAYALATAAVIPICAWAANRYGGKRMWIAALMIFLTSSVLCAFAWNASSLITFRILQGIGSGMMMPIMQTILVKGVGVDKVKPAMVAISVPAVIAPILGPLIGGILLSVFNWRGLFLINIPVCVLALYFAHKRLPNDHEASHPHFDALGLFLLMPGLLAIAWGMHQNEMLVLISGLGLIFLFVLHAIRMREHALVEVTLFKSYTLSASVLILLVSSAAFYAGLLILPLYFEKIQAYSSATIGILLSMQGVGALFARRYLAFFSTRWGDGVSVMIAMGASFIGTLYFYFSHEEGNLILTAVALLFRGAGLGLATVLMLATAYQGLEKKQIAHASVITRIMTQLGAAFGGVGIAMMVSRGQVVEFFLHAFLALAFFTLLPVIPAFWLRKSSPSFKLFNQKKL